MCKLRKFLPSEKFMLYGKMMRNTLSIQKRVVVLVYGMADYGFLHDTQAVAHNLGIPSVVVNIESNTMTVFAPDSRTHAFHTLPNVSCDRHSSDCCCRLVVDQALVEDFLKGKGRGKDHGMVDGRGRRGRDHRGNVRQEVDDLSVDWEFIET